METSLEGGLPEAEECPIITKDGIVWTFMSSTTILISSQKSDKEHMLRLIQQWKDKNV